MTEIASGPVAPVPRDPQPSVDRIEELAVRILKGDILLPKFQRRFVWDSAQILALLDSVSRGFPIGSVLLWQSRQELRSENRIADLAIALPRPDYPVNYLLDGQQRLSVICGAMFWTADDPKSRWNIAYDLRARRFIRLDTLDDPPQHQIRVNKLSDGASFYKQIATLDALTAKDKDALKTNADLLFNSFKNYKIASVTIGDMSIEDVAPIFERINTTGTPLSIVDLMRAATWSTDFDLIDSIEGVLDAVSDKNFEKLDHRVVLRSISAAAGGGFSADQIDLLRGKDDAELKAAVAEVTESYKRAVDFLSTEIGIPNSNVLPYLNQLAVLSEVFRRIPTPTATQHRAIVNWFWASSLTGYFGSWNTGVMAADFAAVEKFAKGQAAEIAGPGALPGPKVWTSHPFRTNTAHSKLLAIILAHHAPRDLWTGQRIDTGAALAWSNSKEFHQFFPQEFLKQNGIVSPMKISALANMVMLTSISNKQITKRAPSDYLRDVEDNAGGRLEEILNSNLISREAFEAAKRDDYEAFLSLRSETIDAAVNRLIARG